MKQTTLEDNFISGKRYDEISYDEPRKSVIYKKYLEFKIPVSETDQIIENIEEFSQNILGERSINLVKNYTPIKSTRELKFLSGISEIQSIIKKVDENFDDIVSRQIFFFEFKEKLNDLWEISKGREKEALSLMEDAIKDLKSEKLTKQKLKALDRTTKILRTKIDKEALIEIDKVFLNAGISTIPVIDELSEMYENE